MTYDYKCSECDEIYEIQHSMFSEDKFNCPECDIILEKQISSTFYVISKEGGLEDHKESEHKKKVYDKERALKKRRAMFPGDFSGSSLPTNDKPDPKHIVRRGKTLGGQEKTVDRQEFIKAAARDPLTVAKAQQALKKAKK